MSAAKYYIRGQYLRQMLSLPEGVDVVGLSYDPFNDLADVAVVGTPYDGERLDPTFRKEDDGSLVLVDWNPRGQFLALSPDGAA